jgi:MoaA/NifB/PqqE/SkfB family radical SAM enzyme
MLFRATGWPRKLPLNYTLSLLYTCNSRCLTCNVWMKNVKGFTVDEYDATFKSVGETPFWFTLSGGEPFLREDIVDIFKVIYKNCKPGIVNIPTNASFYDRIPSAVEEMCKSGPETQLVINVSLDAVGPRHDYIRGFPGNFEKAMKTYKVLRSMDLPNLTVGIHSVISRFNLGDLGDLVDFVQTAQPDSFITEVAEERIELDTVGSPITPTGPDYQAAIDYVMSSMGNLTVNKVGRFTRAFRRHYYELAKRILQEKDQVVACYAGWASCQISPDGDIWPCCIRAQSFGNLRKNDYDFPRIWFGSETRDIRSSIRKKECYCTLANAHYTNMFLDASSLLKVGFSRDGTNHNAVAAPPAPPEPQSAGIPETAAWIMDSRYRTVRKARSKAGTPAETDLRLKCLCGTKISIQQGQLLPVCPHCGRADWWQPVALLS